MAEDAAEDAVVAAAHPHVLPHHPHHQRRAVAEVDAAVDAERNND